MEEKTNRILKMMIAQLNEYEAGEMSLAKLVNDLEWGLLAVEEKLPDEFVRKWYQYWGPLELNSAIIKTSKNFEVNVSDDIHILRKYLSGIIVNE